MVVDETSLNDRERAEVEDISARALELSRSLKREMGKALVGMDRLCDLLLTCLLAEGHAVLEGVPGVAKTTLIKRFSHSLALAFSRIQFTPDLLPADILGNYVYSPADGSFSLRKGPIFANVILADEINRSPPKTQSALLECMQERQATIEGTTLPMQLPFMVMATENPIELEGTYPLPEAQIDRFLFKLEVGYPGKEAELAMLEMKNLSFDPDPPNPVLQEGMLSELIHGARLVHVERTVLQYIRDLVLATRHDASVQLGASPRAAEHFLRAVKAKALVSGRAYATLDDVKGLAKPVLLHRMILTVDAELEEVTPKVVIEGVLDRVPVPR